MSSETPEDKKRVEEALKDSAKLKELVEALSDGAAAAASRQRRSLRAWLLRILKYSCL